MKYLIEGEIVDTYGGDYTYKDVWLENGRYYKRCYGAKPTDVEEITNVNEIEELIHNNVCQKCGNTGRCEPRTLDSPDGQECDCNNENK